MKCCNAVESITFTIFRQQYCCIHSHVFIYTPPPCSPHHASPPFFLSSMPVDTRLEENNPDPGWVGRILLFLGPWLIYPLITLVPLSLVIVFYGLLPLNKPSDTGTSCNNRVGTLMCLCRYWFSGAADFRNYSSHFHHSCIHPLLCLLLCHWY